MASGENRIWVGVMQGKYYPTGGYWGIKNVRGTSMLWRALQELKPILRERVIWEMGDGKNIGALNQPWFRGWEVTTVRMNQNRMLMVADLFDENTGKWKTDMIVVALGDEAM